MTAAVWEGEASYTAIQGQTVAFDDLVESVKLNDGFTPDTVMIEYGDTNLTLEADAKTVPE